MMFVSCKPLIASLMDIFVSIILGLVQGITEFLPISSTAHLTLFGHWMGLISPEHPEQWTAYIAVLQLGTLLAVMIYFAKDITTIIKSFVRENLLKRKGFSQQSFESRMGWYVIAGTLPVVVIGLALKKVIEGNLTKSILVIAVTQIVFALLLALAEKIARHARDMKKITFKDALVVGIGQCFSLIPGASRSGTTMTAGLFLGLERETAARFSFLLSLPAVFASGLLELKDSLGLLNQQLAVSYIMGIITAFVSGFFAIDFLLKFLKTRSNFVFIVYRIVLGVCLLGAVFTGIW